MKRVACVLVLALASMAEGQTPRVAWEHLSSKSGTLPAPNGGTQQTACVTFDVDGNGTDDIILAERTQAPAVIAIRKLDEGWETFIIEANVERPEAGGIGWDVDADGDLDLVIGGDYKGDELWWYENPCPEFNAATPWVRHTIKKREGTAHHDQVVGDFLGTGQAQLVFWNQGARKLFLATPPEDPRAAEAWPLTTLVDTSLVPTATKQEGIDAFDVDGDGQVDLLAGLYWFKRQEGMLKACQIADEPGRIAAGRFKPGKVAQVVVGPGDGTGRLWFYQHEGDDPTDQAQWTRRDLLGRDVVHGHTLALGDVDQDGNLDILCAEMGKWSERQSTPDNPDAHAWILYGDGQGGFEATVFQRGFGFHEGRLADVDGDGRLDVVNKPYNWETPRLDIWLNKGKPAPPL